MLTSQVDIEETSLQDAENISPFGMLVKQEELSRVVIFLRSRILNPSENPGQQEFSCRNVIFVSSPVSTLFPGCFLQRPSNLNICRSPFKPGTLSTAFNMMKKTAGGDMSYGMMPDVGSRSRIMQFKFVVHRIFL